MQTDLDSYLETCNRNRAVGEVAWRAGLPTRSQSRPAQGQEGGQTEAAKGGCRSSLTVRAPARAECQVITIPLQTDAPDKFSQVP